MGTSLSEKANWSGRCSGGGEALVGERALCWGRGEGVEGRKEKKKVYQCWGSVRPRIVIYSSSLSLLSHLSGPDI